MRIISWNVNGIRAVTRNGFLEWLHHEKPDILCVQETKAQTGDLGPEILSPRGYQTAWQSAEKKGYAGVATFFRKSLKINEVRILGVKEFDREGRVQVIDLPGFILLNAYYPNSQPERRRLDYKRAFNRAIRNCCNKLRRQGRRVMVCGDFNVAHKEIDLARPKENRDNPGFYPEECADMDAFTRAGYVDVFRHFHPDEPGHYTWWSYRGGARDRNVGWRLDYHCVDKAFLPHIQSASILREIRGSDHCPILLTLDGVSS